MALKETLRRALERTGFTVRRVGHPEFVDLGPHVHETIDRVADYTQTTPARIAELVHAVEYVERSRLPGAIVECGVWKGGSAMAVALELLRLGSTERDIHLYDTYTGMTEPTEADRDYLGRPVAAAPEPDYLDEARRAVESTGYRRERLHFVKGPVEETLPAQAPEGQIALLRLDTDWYESTLHELEQLYPKLVVGGILIVDDYGHFEGARKATDEYLDGHRVFLHRIDYTGRSAVKQ